MHRWGKWGHYDGACTAESYKYTITLSNINTSVLPFHMFLDSYIADWRIYRWLGGRSAALHAGFIVEGSTIRRTSLCANLDVPPHTDSPGDEYGYTLIVNVNNRSRLNNDEGGDNSHLILGSETQLAEHPYYKVGYKIGQQLKIGQPSKYGIYIEARVTYALDTPSDQVRRFTSFDFSCLTRWHYCTHIKDLLPALEPFPVDDNLPPPPTDAAPAPLPFSPPLWTLGRDAWSVIAIDALSVKTEKNAPLEGKIVTARYKEMLKRAFPPLQGATLILHLDTTFLDSPVHIVAGKRYLVVVRYSFWNGSLHEWMGGVPWINIDPRCIVEDTPQNRQELQRGFAANDPLQIMIFDQ